METNPGSFALFEEMEDSRLGRLFISFNASISGFEQGCRPLLFLDAIPIKAVKKSKILAATSVDAENEVFPVAFAIVKNKSDDNWNWFLLLLKSALPLTHDLTFIFQRQCELDDNTSHIFSRSIYGYCRNSLVEEFKNELDDSWTEAKETAVEDFSSAVYASKIDEFNACVDRIKAVSTELSEWVSGTRPECWSNAFFKGVKYGRYSSEASETFNSWLTMRNEPSAVQAVDIIRCRIMEMIHTRRESSNSWLEALAPSVNHKAQDELLRARGLEVVCCNNSVFRVRDEEETTSVVNVETWECTCRRWQVIGLPAMHALAIFERCGGCASDNCSKYFTNACHRATYAMKSKRAVKCSKCKEYGHYKQTCRSLF